MGREGPSEEKTQKILDQFDLDKNGVLDLNELKPLVAKVMEDM